jgi:hypothetical protein
VSVNNGYEGPAQALCCQWISYQMVKGECTLIVSFNPFAYGFDKLFKIVRRKIKSQNEVRGINKVLQNTRQKAMK